MSAADPAACDAAPDAAALAALAERHGTPLYVYDLGRVAAHEIVRRYRYLEPPERLEAVTGTADPDGDLSAR